MSDIFFRTTVGQRFVNLTLPTLVEQLKRAAETVPELVAQLARLNGLLERGLDAMRPEGDAMSEKLAMNEAEVALVRRVFERYRLHGSIVRVCDEIALGMEAQRSVVDAPKERA